MIRQAHSYLAGAVSGATLIAAAIVVFILLLVSTQGFRDLPLINVGGSESTAVDSADPAAPRGSVATSDSGRSAGASNRSASVTRGGGLATDGAEGTATSPAPGNSAGNGGAGASPGNSSTPTSGGGGGSSSSPSGGGGSGASAGDTVSGTVADTVNGVVDRVDGALGGALDRTGVTDVTQGAVDGVAGSNSVVGQAVDRTAGAVRDLLGGGR